MKSLVSIIKKLTPSEIVTFRSYLTTHTRGGKNKKLELFDELVRRSDLSQFSLNVSSSRQSTYQLKKRLQNELYSFLITQDQQKNGDDQLFLEMDCHRKLYCFKILYDKGIRDHASQVLQDVVDVSSEHGLHGIYLEAINLRNTYFPVKRNVKRKIPIRYQLRKLKKALGRNLYINQYLTGSVKSFFDNDGCFRMTLINELVCFDLSATEPVVEELMEVNHLMHQSDFHSAQRKLVALSSDDLRLPDDEKLRALVCVDLAKAELCLGDYESSLRSIAKARKAPGSGAFFATLLELEFFIHVRTRDLTEVSRITEEARRSKEILENDVLRGKWMCYSLYMSFLAGKYREVIKVINADAAFAFKSKSWLINIKLLELLCILRTSDFDWLFYKIESLRKVVSGLPEKPARVTHLLSLIKTFVSERGSPLGMKEKILQLEREHPWHPIGIEVINYAYILLEVSNETAVPVHQPKLFSDMLERC